MRVLVTGGAGFIGSHLVDALTRRGDDVVVLDNFRRGQRAYLPAGCEVIDGDIRDGNAVRGAVGGVELVYHLAAQSNVMGAMSDVDYSFTTNVVGTFTVLHESAAAEVRRLVFASSREVYGEPAQLPVVETAPTNPKNAYGASKVAGEAYCLAWSSMSKMEVQVLRFANVYGPRDTGRVIPLWVSRALAGAPLQVHGGQQLLDFVWVGTAVESLLIAGDRPPTAPINVGSGKGTALLDLAASVLAATGSKSEIHVTEARAAEVVRFVADTTRMREHLRVKPLSEPLERLRALVTAIEREMSCGENRCDGRNHV